MDFYKQKISKKNVKKNCQVTLYIIYFFSCRTAWCTYYIQYWVHCDLKFNQKIERDLHEGSREGKDEEKGKRIKGKGRKRKGKKREGEEWTKGGERFPLPFPFPFLWFSSSHFESFDKIGGGDTKLYSPLKIYLYSTYTEKILTITRKHKNMKQILYSS